MCHARNRSHVQCNRNREWNNHARRNRKRRHMESLISSKDRLLVMAKDKAAAEAKEKARSLN